MRRYHRNGGGGPLIYRIGMVIRLLIVKPARGICSNYLCRVHVHSNVYIVGTDTTIET